MDERKAWMDQTLAATSAKSDLAKAILYSVWRRAAVKTGCPDAYAAAAANSKHIVRAEVAKWVQGDDGAIHFAAVPRCNGGSNGGGRRWETAVGPWSFWRSAGPPGIALPRWKLPVLQLHQAPFCASGRIRHEL